MERKLTDYLARGLQAELDEAMARFHQLKKADRDSGLITDMKDILRDMESYKSQGFPLTDNYIKEMRLKINNLERIGGFN